MNDDVPQSQRPQYTRRIDIKRAQIPCFYGKIGEHINNWFFLLEHRFKTERLSGKAQTEFAVEFMRDLALETFQRMFPADKPTPIWEELKSKFQKVFVPFNDQMQIRDELARLKQSSGPTGYNQYVHDFNRLINRLLNITEEDRMQYFLGGLSSYTVTRVREACPRTLDDCMEKAGVIENAPERYRKHTNLHSNFKTNGTGDQKPSYKSRHNIMDNPKLQYKPDYRFNKPSVICFKCKQSGHYSTHCTSKFFTSFTE